MRCKHLQLLLFFLIYLVNTRQVLAIEDIEISPNINCTNSKGAGLGYTIGIIGDKIYYAHTDNILASYPIPGKENEPLCSRSVADELEDKQKLKIVKFVLLNGNIYCFAHKSEKESSMLYVYPVSADDFSIGDPQLVYTSDNELSELSIILNKKKPTYFVEYHVQVSDESKVLVLRSLKADHSSSKIKYLARYDYKVYSQSMQLDWSQKRIVNTPLGIYVQLPVLSKNGSIYLLQTDHLKKAENHSLIEINKDGVSIMASGSFEKDGFVLDYIHFADDGNPEFIFIKKTTWKGFSLGILNISQGQLQLQQFREIFTDPNEELNQLSFGKGTIELQSVVVTKDGYALAFFQRHYMQSGYMDFWNAYFIYLDKELKIIRKVQVPIGIKGTLYVTSWIDVGLLFNKQTDQFMLLFNDKISTQSSRKEYFQGKHKFTFKDYKGGFDPNSFALTAVVVSSNGSCNQRDILRYASSTNKEEIFIATSAISVFMQEEMHAIIQGISSITVRLCYIPWSDF